MADSFGLKIGLEGEKEFKKAIADINQSFKVLGSEMKLVSSEFGKNDTSMQAVAARSEVLNKQIDAQKQRIEVLRQALKNASESFEENDRRTQSWQIQLNNAEAALNDMERELTLIVGSAHATAIRSIAERAQTMRDYDKRLIAYQTAMALARSMRSKGLISAKEFAKIDTIIAEKYSISSCSIFR